MSSWITLHIARFPTALPADGNKFPGPARAQKWLFGPDSPTGSDGFRTMRGDVWGGIGLYADLWAAQDVVQDPARHLGFAATATQSWHALLCPIGYRGDVNWFDGASKTGGIACSEIDPGGQMVVLTSAGFDWSMPDALDADLPRIRDFIRAADQVRAWYARQPGNIGRGVFVFDPVNIDGMTFTIWRDEAALARAAYGSGMHRNEVDRYKTQRTADRTSFIRTRLLACSGSWEDDWRSSDLG